MLEKSSEIVYSVVLYRKDMDSPMVILNSTDFKECKERWTSLHEAWRAAHAEAKPFILEKPIITAFEPGLISEIAVKPKQRILQEVDEDNPYKQMMMQKGFGASLQGVAQDYRGAVDAVQYGDILDGGYK